MTDDELAAMEARDRQYEMGTGSLAMDDRHILLAALRDERAARARVEEAAEVVVFQHLRADDCYGQGLAEAVDELAAALAPDASGD